MGKTLIQQARGKGSFSYRVRRKAFIYRIGYPTKLEGEMEVIKLVNSTAHTSPLAKVKYSQGVFYIPAFKGMVEGQKINAGIEVKDGNIVEIKNIPVGTKVYNVEARARDGGKFIRTGGSFAIVHRKVGDKTIILLPSKKEKILGAECRATIGICAGSGRMEKPIMKAGKSFFIKKTRNKLWPRTSAIKMNAIDHPFGSGRGKRIKQKIPKRNSPPGAKVGLLSPRRTGRRK